VPAWVTIALFAALLIPSMEWQRYCSARGVDASTLAYGGVAIRRTALMAAFMVGCALSMIAAVAGALAPGDTVVVAGVVGGPVGGGATMLVMRIRAQRRLRAGYADGAAPGERRAGRIPCHRRGSGPIEMRSAVWCLDRAAGAGARVPPLERTPLVLAHPAPHTGVLTGLQRPGQALADDGAAGAHGLRLGDLSD